MKKWNIPELTSSGLWTTLKRSLSMNEDWPHSWPWTPWPRLAFRPHRRTGWSPLHHSWQAKKGWWHLLLIHVFSCKGLRDPRCYQLWLQPYQEWREWNYLLFWGHLHNWIRLCFSEQSLIFTLWNRVRFVMLLYMELAVESCSCTL